MGKGSQKGEMEHGGVLFEHPAMVEGEGDAHLVQGGVGRSWGAQGAQSHPRSHPPALLNVQPGTDGEVGSSQR